MKNLETVKIIPPTPKSLGPIGSLHWKKTLQVLVPSERITKLDLPIIEIICQTWERIQLILESPDPDWTQYRGLSDMYLKFIDRYGATPRARKIMSISTDTSVTVKSKETKADADIMEEFKL